MTGPRGSRRRAVLVAGLIGLGLVPGPRPAAAAGVEQYLGRPVLRVELAVGGVTRTDPELMAVIDTRPGAPLAMTDVRESIGHLMALGRFDDVQVRASLSGDGVVLRYDCVPRRTVSALEFRGDLGLPARALREAVLARFAAPLSPGRAEDMAAAVETYYRERGYTAARAVPRLEPGRRPERVRLVFDVTAGVRARYGAIRLDGDMGTSAEALFSRLGVHPGAPYDHPALLQRLTRVLDDLRAAGFYEARLDPVVRVSPDGARADLVLAGDRGPHVTVEFRGSPLPRARRDELAPIRREGSADEDLLEDSARNIVQYLRSQGYVDAQARHEREEAGGELRIVFDVQPGTLYHIGSVDLAAGQPLAPYLQPEGHLVPGTPFVQARLDAYVAAVEQQYRQDGYQEARARATVARRPSADTPGGEALVDIRIIIAEGERTRIGTITFDGNASVADARLRAMMRSAPGGPYSPGRVRSDTDAVTLAYLNAGYEAVSVEPETRFGPDRSVADLRFHVQEGPQILVDRILIVGNVRTSARTIERELLLHSGEPLGLTKLAESQQRLSALGLFRRVQVSAMQRGSGTRRDVLVLVEESPATTIGYGGGLEGGRRLRGEVSDTGRPVDSFEIAPRGSFEIGRRNLWGKNRSANLFTRASLRPKDVQVVEGPNGPVQEGGGFGLREYRVLGTYREPRPFGTQADLVLTGFLEQAVRSAFNFRRRGASAELAYRLSPLLSVSGRFGVERTELFNQRIAEADKLDIDRFFPQFRLSAFSASVVRDARDDRINPESGSLFLVDAKIAARAIGSEVGLAKTFLQGFYYHRLPGLRPMVFAAGARLGLATGFQREVIRLDADGRPVLDAGGAPIMDLVQEVPASERFFAGGDTTVRGFALDRLGTPATLDVNGVPKGGDAVVILNGELRAPLGKNFSGVAFLDLGNVFANVRDVDLMSLRGGAGFGLRYGSPIGPIRFDIGFKLDRHRFLDGTRESPFELYIGVGQAF